MKKSLQEIVRRTCGRGTSDYKKYYPDGVLDNEKIIRADGSGSVTTSTFYTAEVEYIVGSNPPIYVPIGTREGWDRDLESDLLEAPEYTTSELPIGSYPMPGPVTTQGNNDSNCELYFMEAANDAVFEMRRWA